MTTDKNSPLKFTPGPWSVGDGMSKYSNGESIDVRSQQRTVCWIHFWADETVTTKISHEQEMADARLISAAPELLEACVALMGELESRFDYPEPTPDESAALRKASAAIARAHP